MENKYLQQIKENVFTKFINFIKGIFRKKENKEAISKIEEVEKEKVESSFSDSIRIYREENKELLNLQKKYENKEINLDDLSNEELDELDILYKRQVTDLKKKLEDKKTQLNMIKFKLNNYSANN